MQLVFLICPEKTTKTFLPQKRLCLLGWFLGNLLAVVTTVYKPLSATNTAKSFKALGQRFLHIYIFS